MDNIREMSTIGLINMLTEASKNGNQELVNVCAFEMAYRTYIYGKGKTFEELLLEFGYYVEPEEEVVRKK